MHTEQQLHALLQRFKSQQKTGGRALALAGVAAAIVLQVLLITIPTGLSAADRVSIAGSFLTADAILFAAWQWWAQRREVTLEAYFSRIDAPNNRRLAFYEQLLSLPAAENKEIAEAITQFYVFYVYAEIDNLEYAMTKYVEHSISQELAERAAYTFISRCRQSNDFRDIAYSAVDESGYDEHFEQLVRDLVGRVAPPHSDAPPPHPMKYDELAIVRRLLQP